MTQGLFITGTDTEVGKTLVTAALLQVLSDRGQRVAGMKPIAAGCHSTPEGLRNDDALALHRYSPEVDYATVNPYALEPPIAPHIAAADAGVAISLSRIQRCYGDLAEGRDYVLVEGAGGWRVPLDAQRSLADIAKSLHLPVILVVGVRLGCINHALLTQEAIAADGLPLVGWVANCIAPATAQIPAQLDALRHRLSAPCLGVVPCLSRPTPALAATYLDPAALLAPVSTVP